MIERQKIDKSSWPNGPWKDEDDFLEFQHAGFNCRVARVPHYGTLNGYVFLPQGHSQFGKHYDAIDVSVHGDLTYSELQENDKFWVLGFDTGHAWDIMPLMPMLTLAGDATYKDFEFVEAETKNLADQLSRL